MTDPTPPDDSAEDRPDDDRPDLEELGFAGALAELEVIVAQLESDALDVDLLSDRVERAATLVRWCRDRIDATRFHVEEILERLEPDADVSA